MKVVILAGGLGTRLSKERGTIPKPLVTIGEIPIIQHVMKIYSNYGINDFVICLGHQGNMIKEYFMKLYSSSSKSTTIRHEKDFVEIQDIHGKWKIMLVDTGEHTNSADRIKRVKQYLDKTFCVTYADTLSDVNIHDIISFHKKNTSICTLTAIRHRKKDQMLILEGNDVVKFEKKTTNETSWSNGGFFVFDMKVIDHIYGDDLSLEYLLESLAHDKQLSAFKHEGFWESMNTPEDRDVLETLWSSGKAPWKV